MTAFAVVGQLPALRPTKMAWRPCFGHPSDDGCRIMLFECRFAGAEAFGEFLNVMSRAQSFFFFSRE